MKLFRSAVALGATITPATSGAGAPKKAVIKTFTVAVTDGQINPRFVGVLNGALVSAISLVKV